MDPSKAKANFSRLGQLLVDKGGDALRATLHAIHPPSTLGAVLKTNKSVLKKIRRSVITSQQWDLLFPTSGMPDSKNFDVTLLTILLRNICGLSPPATGWNAMPPTGDTSKSADIVRIKLFRNKDYGHIASAQLDDATFEKLWQEISQPLTRLGIPQKDIDEIKVAPLSPQKEWKPTSRLLDKLPMFTGRDTKIQKIVSFLMAEEKAVVSLHGGPGFGKTAIASQVSHKLSEDHNIVVVFSQLATATNEDEMIRQFCLDFCINYENEPKKSLIFRLSNIKVKVILVMDDIENLLEEKCRSAFDDFIRLLLKQSNSNCQIITTSRSSYLIPELSMGSLDVGEMESTASMELLRKHCRKEKEKECCHQDEKFLRRLAVLCGHVPLAICIAGSLVDDFLVKDADELLQDLEKQPMETLEYPESNQFVKRAIDVSYEKFSKEEQETFVRLSVFEGSFSVDAAEAVIEKRKSDTRRLLKKLFRRSLIRKPIEHRYSIHLLIKHFLKDKKKGWNEKAEGARAEVLMVEFYLELGHQLTMKSYSKDGYKDDRETLMQEASNIQNVLKICSQQDDLTSSDISDCLASSKIYNTSARLFSVFVRTITPGQIVDEFLQRCANLAKEKKQHAIKINFDCLLVAEERYNTIGKSDEDFISKMEEIKKEFETHHEDLKEDKTLCAHYCYQNGRYLWRKSRSNKGKDALDLQTEARDQLKKSLELRKTLPETPQGKADSIFSLLQLGKICRSIGLTERHLKKPNASKTSFGQAKEYYREAIQLSESDLGGHELTSSCYKHSGDLFLTTEEFELAEKEYTTAKNMRENLGLDTSEKYAFILKNLGGCLIESERADEAIEVLEKACDIVEKLPESAKLQNVWLIRAYASLAIAYDRVHKNSEAVDYANKAMELTGGQERIIPKFLYNKLLKILKYNKQ